MKGIEQFRSQLEALDKKLRNKIVKQALRAGAKLIAGAVRSRAPKKSGLLKRSVKVRAGRRRKDRQSVNVVVTGGHKTPMVAGVEFGTEDMVPRPFMRPAFEAEKGPALERVISEVRGGLS